MVSRWDTELKAWVNHGFRRPRTGPEEKRVAPNAWIWPLSHFAGSATEARPEEMVHSEMRRRPSRPRDRRRERGAEGTLCGWPRVGHARELTAPVAMTSDC